jgi:hypothetical protein
MTRALRLILGPALALCLTASIQAQGTPVATRQVDFSAFAGVTGIYTGLSQGRNAAVTVGIDLNLPEIAHFRPALEVRATEPFDHGSVDAQRSLLAGLRVETRYGRLHPYVDFLAGGGQITFVHPYVRYDSTILTTEGPSTVLSPGAGLRYDLTPHFSLIADAQFQRWNTAASLSGHLFSKPLTLGLTYTFAPHQRHPR